MNRSELYAHLAQNRRLLGMARDRFASLTDGLDHPGIDSAREELAAADAALSSAAGGISLWIRHCISLLAYGMSAWAVSAFTGRLLGLPAGWTIAVTVATLLALASPVSMLKDAIADRVNHRRTMAPASPLPGPVTPDDPDPAAELIMMLRSVRDGLTVAMRRLSGAHRFGFVAHSAAGFDWLRRHDRHLFEVSLADRLLCQAIDSIEIWRGRVAPEPAARWRILSLTAEPVKAIDAELHECAESAELAAVAVQHAELDGPRRTPAVIGRLESAAGMLRSAAEAHSSLPAFSRREMTMAALTPSVWAISCVALLAITPNPAEPIRLAIILTGTILLSMVVGHVVSATWTRREARRLAIAVNRPDDVRNAIAQLWTRIHTIAGALKPASNDRHPEVGRRIDAALFWIDAADDALAETAGR